MGWRIDLGQGVTVASADGVAAPIRARKARALLAWLAEQPDRTAARRDAIALLWSDRATEQGRASLRQCLFELKGEAPGLIDADADRVALTADTVVEGASAATLNDVAGVDAAFDRWLTSRAPADPPRPPRASHSRRPAVALLSLLVLAIGVAIWWSRAAEQRPFIPAIALATPGVSAVTADPFGAALRATLPNNRVRAHGSSAPAADWVVTLSPPEGRALFVRIATATGDQLWAEHLPLAGDAARTATTLGGVTGGVIACTMRAPDGPPRDVDLVALVMDFCGKLGRRDGTADAPVAARRLTAAYPRYAYGHGVLAMYLARDAAPTPANAAEGEREARRALALDARTGEAWMALGVLAQDRRDLRQAEALFRRGIAAQPDHASLHNYLADVLASVGRTGEALDEARRATALDPASPVKLVTAIGLLARSGRPRAAMAWLDRAEAERGPVPLLSHTRLDLLEKMDDIAGAQALLDRAGSSFLEPAAEADARAVLAVLRHRTAPIPPDLLDRLSAHGDTVRVAERLLVASGRLDAAAALAGTGRGGTAGLFGPEMAPLWRDPRFPAIARTLNLWRYWTESGHWPDICADRSLRWRCGSVNSPSTPR